jgi:5-(carboxyamino)imidazole ribonucleotide mutase
MDRVALARVWSRRRAVDAPGSRKDLAVTSPPTKDSFSARDAPTVPPLIGVVMGSKSDWETMQHASEMLAALGVPHEVRVVSAHRTPDLLFEYAEGAEARGLRAIVAGAGGAAHLPGMLAAKTHLPVLGVPVQSKALQGLDSLLSIVQMPAGVPVPTFAIGRAGAINAALTAAAILSATDPLLRERLLAHRRAQTETVLATPDPRG